MPTMLASLVEQLRPDFAQAGEVALYQNLAARLSRVAGQDRAHPWTWRYVQSVHHNTLGHPPSKKFAHAVELLAAEMDGLPAVIADTEAVTVYARPGSVHPGAVLIGTSLPCAWPSCRVHFVKTHPRQVYCPVHRDPHNRKF